MIRCKVEHVMLAFLQNKVDFFVNFVEIGAKSLFYKDQCGGGLKPRYPRFGADLDPGRW